MCKQQRYYEVKGGLAYVYDRPRPELSSFVSIVGVDDLPYYRRNFDLKKVFSNHMEQDHE